MLQKSRAFVTRKRSSLAMSFAMILVLAVGAVALLAPVETFAKGPGGGRCGKCPCADTIVLPDGTECWLDFCHVVFGYPDCLWDCGYICPFPE